jgi:hypothetical protein
MPAKKNWKKMILYLKKTKLEKLSYWITFQEIYSKKPSEKNSRFMKRRELEQKQCLITKQNHEASKS